MDTKNCRARMRKTDIADARLVSNELRLTSKQVRKDAERLIDAAREQRRASRALIQELRDARFKAEAARKKMR